MPAPRRVTAFAAVLGLVFGLAWLVGSFAGPTPSPPRSGPSIPAGSTAGMR
ncbi:hypothetical protein [Amycolatopsis sp. lyj-346]|uniref:hypothetical protein n=1 Tax=Amycolatopsis sp. lyj-346 TaxID=2789289 RepID=UPI00397E1AC2